VTYSVSALKVSKTSICDGRNST